MKKLVDPLCKKSLHPFVEINGLFMPCCYLTTSTNHEKELRSFFGEDYENLKVQNNTPSNIVKLWSKIRNSWDTENPYVGCLRSCPKNGKLKKMESK
jgi:hypothetical protein